jgi:hypothetical protein
MCRSVGMGLRADLPWRGTVQCVAQRLTWRAPSDNAGSTSVREAKTNRRVERGQARLLGIRVTTLLKRVTSPVHNQPTGAILLESPSLTTLLAGSAALRARQNEQRSGKIDERFE